MKIKASVSWNPDIQFEEADLVDIVLSFENGEAEEFRGQLKRPDTAMSFLWNLYVQSIDDYSRASEFVGEVIEDSKGRRVYEIPVLVKDDKLDHLKYTAERIQKQYYIVSRDELVTDEEHCTFFGSSGNLWSTEKCDYPRGDFVETLRQTVYDMENVDPKIYEWTNVPNQHSIRNRMKSDPIFREFAERELMPLVDAYWKSDAMRKGDTGEIKRMFIEIADVAGRYKDEHGIERL